MKEGNTLSRISVPYRTAAVRRRPARKDGDARWVAELYGDGGEAVSEGVRHRRLRFGNGCAQVLCVTFVWQRGQVMAMVPLPRGTRMTVLHCLQRK